ncbi:HAD-IA family hydrolase [Microbacterium sp. Marseille-Q6965]|uniref:HAD-IA family hydrolase n=1 Tax=Microbacterium sp. Marseille-Q6965 TaxID=2965072 RepID=UPI0021B81090|nr:HAD-IA family hydrolase [Microbacterium sp. Marseille-Q6965]
MTPDTPRGRGDDGWIDISGVLFDLDGTLIDSIPAVEDAWRLWARELGVSGPGPDQHGLRAAVLIEALGIPPERRAAAERRLREVESRPGQRIEMLPGVATLLRQLPASAWGIVTSAARPVAEARLGAARLLAPAVLVTGDDVERGKPDPAPYARGMALLRAATGSPGAVLAFEDTAAGVASARAAGAIAIGVVGTESRAQLEPFADAVVDSLRAVRFAHDEHGLRARLTPGSGG